MAITQTTVLPLEYGHFTIAFHRFAEGECISVSKGELTDTVPIIRIHSSCLFGESFHGLDCDCSNQLSSTLKLIGKHKSGAVLYHYAEGRGIGLENKIQALELQRTKKIDTLEAFKTMGYEPDIRDYTCVIKAMKDLKIAEDIFFASQNPKKIQAIKDAGYTIKKIIHPAITLTKYNRPELLSKKNKLGYDIQSL